NWPAWMRCGAICLPRTSPSSTTRPASSASPPSSRRRQNSLRGCRARRARDLACASRSRGLAFHARQMLERHLQDDQGIGRAVVWAHQAGGPVLVVLLILDQLLADRRIPGFPLFVARLPHRLGGVVVTVEVVHVQLGVGRLAIEVLQ